jgi:hypothetical protein
LGREGWRERFQEVEQFLDESRDQMAELQIDRDRLEHENLRLNERVAELESELARPRPVHCPVGEAPPGQQYGVGMITLCVNLGRIIGLRPTTRALHVVFEWLGVKEQIPTYQSIRGWMQRIGLDRMQSVKKTTGGVWLVDHTNQIGKEKVLTILRVRRSKSPRAGIALRHRDVELLAVIPGQSWSREDVANVYRETVKRCGVPRAIESDGAVELREPVASLGKPGKRPLSIRDFKHFLANQFEALLTRNEQYPAFTKQLGGTRSAVQQTELSHFVPPSFKMKARFMNLAPILRWASMVLWHLDHSESKSRQGIADHRIQEKLGWLRDYASQIKEWQACQNVISTGLTFISQQGIFPGVAAQFEKRVAGQADGAMSRKLVSKAVAFLQEHEVKLRPGERLPMSTDILESSFALYKQLERQHSKSGFTSLLLTFPILLRKTTPKEVKASFRRVKVADVKAWTMKHLPKTLTAKRQLAFREPKSKTKGTTKNSATPFLAAA